MHLRAPSSDPTRTSSASTLRRSPRAATALAAAATLVALSACSAPAAEPAAEATDASTPHGYVEGASEGSEPQLRLATVDPEGRVDLLDLLDGESEGVAEIDPADSLSTDGRFVFATRASGTVDVVDTGVWTVDHGDHSHYYLAEPRTVGTVEASTPTPGRRGSHPARTSRPCSSRPPASASCSTPRPWARARSTSGPAGTTRPTTAWSCRWGSR
nr:hypothetical protein GCM10025699_62050 [Microbacterium flavescens]